MKKKLIGLSQRYAVALREHLRQGSRASLQVAWQLGREAVTLGLATLEIARIHDQALAALQLKRGKSRGVKRAGAFFAEASTQTDETQRTTRQSRIDLGRLQQQLNRRTLELVATNRQLVQGVARSKVVADAAKKSGRQHDQCLEKSLLMQQHLRRLTHRALAAQEDERTRLSRELQNEIAQTLLGINVRLLSLRHEGGDNLKGLKNEIASTQRLVLSSARTVRRFTHELEVHPAAKGPLVSRRAVVR
jgi:signal transduction histidine kinase